ncbi:MAG: hypothetical protein ABIN68_07175 [Sphingomicrobium sp.]
MNPAPLFALLALNACTSIVAAPTGPAALGQVTAVESLQVRPLALLEDSRCPASVQCIWAGQVRIRAEVTSRSGRELREMTLGTPISVSGGTLTLVDAQPPKLAPGTTDAGQYRFSFQFVR